MKFLIPLQTFSKDSILSHLLAYSIHSRRRESIGVDGMIAADVANVYFSLLCRQILAHVAVSEARSASGS